MPGSFFYCVNFSVPGRAERLFSAAALLHGKTRSYFLGGMNADFFGVSPKNQKRMIRILSKIIRFIRFPGGMALN